MFRSETSARGTDAMLADRYLPEYDVTEIRHAVVDADPATTYETMLRTDLLELGPVVAALGELRDLPRTVRRGLRGTEGEASPERMRFVDVADTDEWTLLAEAPGEEYVFGAVGTFWRPSIEWRQVEPDAFASFDDPGYAKLAISLSVRPYGEGRTLLSYEARTATTDERARRNFRRYWRVIGPFAGYLMSRALDRIAADAEAAERARRASPRRSLPAVTGRPGRTAGGIFAAAALALAASYHVAVRPWHRRWGSTDAEATGPLAGDDLLPAATEQVTHAVEIDAPAQDVWPWLVQIGQARGGFYSYDWLENLVGADIHNVDRVLPEYQDLAEGDVVRLATPEYAVETSEAAPEVALLEPERALVLRPPVASPPWTWAFVLEPTDDGTTRLLARIRSVPSRSAVGPLAGLPVLGRAVQYLFWEPAHFVMERRMLLGIKQRAETPARRERMRVP